MGWLVSRTHGTPQEALERPPDQAGAREKPEYEEGRERAHERDFNNINGIRIPNTGKQKSLKHQIQGQHARYPRPLFPSATVNSGMRRNALTVRTSSFSHHPWWDGRSAGHTGFPWRHWNVPQIRLGLGVSLILKRAGIRLKRRTSTVGMDEDSKRKKQKDSGAPKPRRA